MPWLHVHSLELTQAGWCLIGGGGSNGHEGEFDQRPTLAELGAPAVSRGRGWSVRRAAKVMPGRASGVSWAEVRAATGVSALGVDDRVVPVAEHGVAVVVWGDHVPRVSVLDASGTAFGTISLTLQ